MKKNNYKSILFTVAFSCLAVLIFGTKYCLGQDANPDFVPPTPRAQEMTKYGDYPVGHFTGVPDISIPIYEINFHGFKMPVKLRNHASGIKYGHFSDAYGLGWSLMCGGEISRTINNVPDENTLFEKRSPSCSHSNVSTIEQLARNQPGLAYDLEYDEYNITLPTGDYYSFYFQNIQPTFDPTIDPEDIHDIYQIHIMPENDIQIVPKFDFNNMVAYGPRIDGFTVIDKYGNKYEFGQEKEYRTINSFTNVSSWMLSSIKPYITNDSITFSYLSSSSTTKILNSNRVITDSVDTFDPDFEINGVDQGYYDNDPNDNRSWISDYVEETTTLITNHSCLVNQVSFNGYNISFTYNTSRASSYGAYLEKIDLPVNNQELGFNMSSIGQYPYKRLNSIEFRTLSDSYSFLFEYYPFVIGPDFAPVYDHWGYVRYGDYEHYISGINMYNVPDMDVQLKGIFDKKLLDPLNNPYVTANEVVNIGSSTCDRDPLNILNVISKITYPTGGYTEFEFEANKYHSGGSTLSAGGYRIKEIRNYDSGLASKKRYKYGVAESDYGFAPVEPNSKTYAKELLKVEALTVGGTVNTSDEKHRARQRSFSSNNFTALLGSRPPVMYPEVAEYFGDETNNQGKIVYKYNILNDDNIFEEALSINSETKNLYVPAKTSWAYGKLTDEEIYKKTQTGYELTKSIEYVWDDYSRYTLYSCTNYMQYVLFDPNYEIDNLTTNGDLDEGKGYNYDVTFIHIGSQRLGSKTVTEEGMVLKETYNYNSKGLLSSKEIIQNGVGLKKFEYTYPIDIVGGVYPAMTSMNMLAYPIERKTIKSGSILGSELTTYQNFSGKYLPYQTFNIEVVNPLSSFISFNGVTKDANYGSAVQTISSYDVFGNPTSVSARNGVTSSYIWGFNGQYLLTKTTSGGTNTITENWDWYPLIGMKSYTDPTGIKTYYNYDDFNKLVNVKNNESEKIREYQYNYGN